MDKFQVPQFIETEDKIIGPLTLRQFFYLAAAGGILFILFLVVRPGVWFVFLGIFGGTALAFAFIKINGHSFAKILYLGLRYYWNPRLYLWRKKDVGAEPIQEIERVIPSQPPANVRQKHSPQLNVPHINLQTPHLPVPQFGKIKDLWQQMLTSKGKMLREKTFANGSAVIKAPGGGHIAATRVDYES